VRGEFVDIGGPRLYYYAAGTRGIGEPLLLIHGFPTSSHLWTRVVPLVPAGYRIVVPDLLGFGRSELGTPDSRGADLSIVGHATRLARLLDVLQIEKVCAVGHGTGAAIALAMRARQPARVSRLCLVDAVTSTAAWPTLDGRHARAILPLLHALPGPLLLALVRRRLVNSYRDAAASAQAASQYLRPFRGPRGRATLLGHLRSLNARGATVDPTSTVPYPPTAIVWGADDPLLPLLVAQRLHATIPDSTLDVVAGGHFSPEESPEQVAAVLANLLNGSK
jgi:pimeloyl-ACP methyl ester carboxylesterase